MVKFSGNEEILEALLMVVRMELKTFQANVVVVVDEKEIKINDGKKKINYLLPSKPIIEKKKRSNIIIKMEKKKKDKEKNKSLILILPSPSPPIIPSNMMKTINGVRGTTTPIWIGEKTLFPSDVNSSLSRLFFPKSEAFIQYLTHEERNVLENKKNPGTLDVMVVDPKGWWWNLKFKLWKSIDKYVLTTGWTDFVDENKLESKIDIVQLWAFRQPQQHDHDDGLFMQLCFAINVRRVNSFDHCSEAGTSVTSIS